MADDNSPQTTAVGFSIAAPRLPYHSVIEERFGVSKSAWKALTEAVYPAAKTVDSVIMVLSYCQARRLDPMKRPVHIVPVYSSAANNGKGGMVDTIWPGISEQRTTAMRTGLYAGCDEVEFGPDMTETWTWTDDKKGDQTVSVTFPEWARMTLFRMVGGQRVAIVGPKVYWMETYATVSRWSPAPNEMWRRRPRGQIEKCAEAAGLRRAFPEELGDEPTAEEMEGRIVHDQLGSSVGPRPSLTSGFGETIEHERLEAPRTADPGPTSDDGAKSGEGHSAPASAQGGGNSAGGVGTRAVQAEDAKGNRVLLTVRADAQIGSEADPLFWNGVHYPTKTRLNEVKRLAKKSAKPAQSAADPKPTSDSATDASGPSAGGTSSPEPQGEPSGDGEVMTQEFIDPDTGVVYPTIEARLAAAKSGDIRQNPSESADSAGDAFPGDKPLKGSEPKEPDHGHVNPMILVMDRLANAVSWTEMLEEHLKPLAQTPEWKAAERGSRTVIREAAWARFNELQASGQEKTDVTSSFGLMRMWLDFGATSAEEIEMMWPAFYRSPDFRGAGEADRQAIMQLAGARKVALRGGSDGDNHS